MSEELDRARAAVAKLTGEEKRRLFKEMGLCACKSMIDVIEMAPEAGAGALVGGILGLAWKALKGKDDKK